MIGMNKKNEEKLKQKQLKAINGRLEKLVDKMNKDYNNCIQELLQLSVLLQNIETSGEALNTNKALMR